MEIDSMSENKNYKKISAVDVVMYLVVIICVAVLIGCVALLVPKFLEYRDSDEAFQQISDMSITSYNTESSGMSVDASIDVSDAIQIDWDAFKDTEIVAWFQMDDISYPIMQHSDNSYYLKHLPDGTYNGGGSIFLLNHNNPLFTDQSSFVYGHNMNNGSMFGSLKNYTTSEYKDHLFYIYLPDGTRHVYQFFSVAVVYQDSKAYTWAFASDETYMEWQQWMLDQSIIKTSCEMSKDARYVTLSTCNGYSGTNHRLIVCGQEIRVDMLQQPASWYQSYLDAYNQKNDKKIKRAEEIAHQLHMVQQKNADILYQCQGY